MESVPKNSKSLESSERVEDFASKFCGKKPNRKINILWKLHFLHRYFVKNLRFDRLILLNLDGSQLELLAEADLISHYCWLSNSTLAVYMSEKNHDGAFFVVNIEDKSKTIIRSFLNFGDGHPSGDNEVCVVDAYPDRSGMQHLYISSNIHNNVAPNLISKFYHPLKFSSHSRCDLHPRFDSSSNTIYVDSVFSGKRQLYRIKLNWKKNTIFHC